MKTQMDTNDNQWIMENKERCSCGRKKGEWHSSYSHVYGENKNFNILIIDAIKAPKLGKIKV